ncbi:MAG TPA: hypothetical protein VM820_04680 [Vicinamibacterales bacterium]|nr:hypothetical protein [Vicinamibacterales bacterium]
MATISIARILELGITIGWQEAVEVADAAGHQATASGRSLVPEHCLISTEGRVELVGQGQRGQSSLSALGLLGLLLQGQSAPAELVALAAADGASAASGQPVRDLSWFVRPDGQEEIARLAVRALAADSDDSVRSEIRRLRAATPATAEAAPMAAGGSRWRRVAKAVGLGAMAALAVLIGVAGVRFLRSSDLWPATVATADVTEATETRPVGAVSPPLSRLVSGVEADRAPRAGSPSTSASASPPSMDLVTAGGTTVAPSAPRETTAASTPVPAAATGVEFAEPWAGSTSPYLYSSVDADVVPPVLVHPQLPSEPKADSTPTGSAMEVMVDESGRVLRVRLHPAETPSLNDRMLVSAAKAWQFRPAIRGGHAVPYVLRIPVTR